MPSMLSASRPGPLVTALAAMALLLLSATQVGVRVLPPLSAAVAVLAVVSVIFFQSRAGNVCLGIQRRPGVHLMSVRLTVRFESRFVGSLVLSAAPRGSTKTAFGSAAALRDNEQRVGLPLHYLFGDLFAPILPGGVR
jgi:hypothetical protein